MSVSVRRAVVEDARTIAEFALKLFAQHTNYNPNRFTIAGTQESAEWFYGNQTKAVDAAILVAEIENKIVGFAYLEFEERNYASLLENAVWLHDLYIDEAARGHNAGTLLLEESVKVAKEFGAERLMLSTATQNEFARKFFERNGFTTTMVEMMFDLTK
jgi:GNAT superfamily N-acetyltransferase